MRQLVKQLIPLATFCFRKLQKLLTILVMPLWKLFSWLLGLTFSDYIFCHNSVIQWFPRGFFKHFSLMSAISFLDISSSSSISLPAVSTTSLEMLLGIPPFSAVSLFSAFIIPSRYFYLLLES